MNDLEDWVVELLEDIKEIANLYDAVKWIEIY